MLSTRFASNGPSARTACPACCLPCFKWHPKLLLTCCRGACLLRCPDDSEVFINDLLRVTHGDFEMPPMECPQSSATCGAQPSRAKRGPAARSAAAAEGGRRRKAPGSRRRPPSLARASNKSTDASLLAATELVASKQPWSAGKRALHERDIMDQRGSRTALWRMGSRAIWRPLVTWRRVLRTIYEH